MSKELLERIDGKMDNLDGKVSKIDNTVSKLEVYVGRNTDDLEEHIEGVTQNRDRIFRLEKIEQFLRGAAWITLGLGSLALLAIKLFK